MIRDIYLGLIVMAVATASVAHRSLPRFSDAEQATAKVTAPQLSPPTEEKPAEKSAALTTIFPDGYDASKAKPKDKPELLEPPKKSKSVAPKKKDTKPADQAPGDGPVLLVEEDGPSLPVMPGLAAEKESEKPKAPEKSAAPGSDEIVTEFVPFTEELPLPEEGDTKKNAGASKNELNEPKPEVLAESEVNESNLNPPSLFPPPGKPERTPSGTELPIVALPIDRDSDGTGSDAKGIANRSRSKSEELPPTVFSFDRRIATSDAPVEKDKSKAAPVGGNPVHPFFARYLERKTYFVREGDTLDSIAVKLYQDPSTSQRLFEMNKHQLKQPGDLRPGMLLRLP